MTNRVDNSLSIAVISKSDAAGGGASRKAGELVELLNAAGHRAHHWVSYIKGEYKPYHRFLYGSRHGKWVGRIRAFSKRWGYVDLPPVEMLTLLRQRRLYEYDLVHFHDLSSAISPLTVRYVARRRPTVWTFRDCSPFTGGCLYPQDCTAYMRRCGHCPQLGQWPLDTRRDRTGFLQDVKRKTAAEGRFMPAAPSQWMAGMAMKSAMFQAPPEVVPNGIPVHIFKPQDKARVRTRLGLPLDRKIVLLTAMFQDSPRKGGRYAAEALAALRDLAPLGLLVGNVFPERAKQLFGEVDCHCTGKILDASLLADWYAAADVFLCPSLADNLPSTVLESMACGLPVVAFKTGGIPEMVGHGVNGHLADQRDVCGLIAGLRAALQVDPGQQWGQESRKIAEARFTDTMMRDNYLSLYRRAIASWERRG
jgi:glycosyltransferase involved in cell wall biosynthesis